MERAQAEVAGLGKDYGVLHGLRVPDLPYEDHIGGLPQRIPQGVEKRMGIEPDLPLGHYAFLVAVDELDRVFYGDDMTLLVLVPVVYHGREGGRFPAARRTHHQHETALVHGDILQYPGQTQVVDSLQVYLDLPEHDAHVSTLPEDIDPEPAQVGVVEGKVHLVLFLEHLPLSLVHDARGNSLGIIAAQDTVAVGQHHAFNPEHGGYALGQIDVGSILLHHVVQEVEEKRGRGHDSPLIFRHVKGDLFLGHEVSGDEVFHRRLHGLHPQLPARLHGGGDLGDLILSDKVPHCR